MASAQRPIAFDTQEPRQHHRLMVEANCLLNGQTAFPVAADVHLGIQTTYLSYIRNARQWKKMDDEVLP
jgi:hypothetical protein